MPDITYTYTDDRDNAVRYRETWEPARMKLCMGVSGRLYCLYCGARRVWYREHTNCHLCLRCGLLMELNMISRESKVSTGTPDARRLAALREVERHSPYNRESDIPTDTPTAPDPEPAEPVSISQLHHMALCTNREVANLQDSVIALNRAIASLETRYSQLRREIPAPTTTPAQGEGEHLVRDDEEEPAKLHHASAAAAILIFEHRDKPFALLLYTNQDSGESLPRVWGLCPDGINITVHGSDYAAGAKLVELLAENEQLRAELRGHAEPQPADYLPVLTNRQYRALLDLLMCSDPWPITDGQQGRWQHATIIGLADHDALMRGYDNWIVAYHEHYYRNDTTSTPDTDTDTPNTPSTPPNAAPEPARTYTATFVVRLVKDLVEQERTLLREAIANGLMEMADRAKLSGGNDSYVAGLVRAAARVRNRHWEP